MPFLPPNQQRQSTESTALYIEAVNTWFMLCQEIAFHVSHPQEQSEILIGDQQSNA